MRQLYKRHLGEITSKMASLVSISVGRAGVMTLRSTHLRHRARYRPMISVGKVNLLQEGGFDACAG